MIPTTSRRIVLKRISPASAALIAILFLCVSTIWGIGIGLHETGRGCGDPADIHLMVVIVTNLAINGILISGYFTLGLTTIFAAPPLLILTGYTIGRTVQAYGNQGVELLLPHGVIEVSTWAAALYIGFIGLRRPVRENSAVVERRRPSNARRVLTYIALATIAAGIVERFWTSWYGPHMVCSN